MNISQDSQESAVRKNLLVALTLSAAISIYLRIFGTNDVENSLNVSFSIAAGRSGGFTNLGTREFGTFSYLGVPLFDALQGIGGRLPYQSSWPQSPEWPLRYIFGDFSFVLTRVFVASLVMFLSAFRTLSSWKPQLSSREQILFGALLCAPVGVYLRNNEWSDVYCLTAGIIGIAFLLLNKRFFQTPLANFCEKQSSKYELFLLFWCVAMVATGHPGLLPAAVIVLLPLLILLSCITTTRQNVFRFVRENFKVMALLIVPALLTIGLVVFELLSEADGAVDYARQRTIHTQGFYTDQAFIGVSRGIVPEFVERVAGVIAAFFFQPIVRILYENLLPVNQPTRSLTGSFPRGEFGGGLILVAVLVSYRSLRTGSPEKVFFKVLVAAQLITLVLTFIAGNDLLPAAVAPSAAWVIFIILLAINVLAAFILNSLRTKNNRLLKPILWIKLLTVGIWVLMQLSFLTIYPKPHMEIPSRQEAFQAATSESSLSRLFPSGRFSRLAMASFERYPGSEWSTALTFLSQGKPVVAPVEQKIRNVNQLTKHAPTQSKIRTLSISNKSAHEVDQLADFLEIEHLLIREDDPIIVKNFQLELRSLFRDLNRQDKTEIVKISERRYLLWTRSSFTSSVVQEGESVDSGYCPVLEERCDVLTKSFPGSRSEVPRLSVCEKSCLWRYQVAVINRGDSLVIPVIYEESLVVTTSQATNLTTRNLGGFLGVTAADSAISGTLEIGIQPDSRMYGRVLVSYSYLCSFLVLILVSVRRRKVV